MDSESCIITVCAQLWNSKADDSMASVFPEALLVCDRLLLIVRAGGCLSTSAHHSTWRRGFHQPCRNYPHGNCTYAGHDLHVSGIT